MIGPRYAVQLMDELQAENTRLREETARLKNAIKMHRAQRADDRCIEDDDRLYEALGDGIKCDRRIGNPELMLANCKRFIRNRCEAGGPWKSYQELEAELAVYHQVMAMIRAYVERPETFKAWSAEFKVPWLDALVADRNALRDRAAALERTVTLRPDRETLGELVRKAWVEWARAQPHPKPSWLVPWGDLGEPDREADRQIGEAVARYVLLPPSPTTPHDPAPPVATPPGPRAGGQ